MKRSLGHTGTVRINVLGGNNPSFFGGGNIGGGGGGNNGGDALLFGGGGTGGSGGSDSAVAWTYHIDDTNINDDYHGNSTHDNFGLYDDAEKNDYWTPVIIRGDPVGAFAAVRQILPLLVADSSTSNTANGGSGGVNETGIHDGIVLDVPIHWSKHNLLVGRGGHTIAALSATYQTRIMIPPPPPSTDSRNGNNVSSSQPPQNQQQPIQQQLPAGGGSGSGATSSTMPSNVIQLEGDDIDLVEQCLAKMISIVTGEEVWVPTGRRISVDNKENEKKIDVTTSPSHNTAAVEDDESDQIQNTPTTSTKQNTNSRTTKKDEDDTVKAATAEAIIIKTWTPASKLLNLGKIRKIQRKTNTTIRRKKIRLVDGVCVGGGSGGNGANLGGKVVIDDEKDEEAEELDDDADDAEEEDGEVVSAGEGNNDGMTSGK